jgi:hypothetical protein
MAAHITYVSEMALQRKFGRALQNRDALSFQFTPDFQIESYLHHQGATFVDRFDANSYLYITRAMDYFDLAEEHGGQLSDVFRLNSARFCIISFTSDWLFPPVENKRIAHALNAVAAQVSFVEIKSDKGHDAFLLDEPEMFAAVDGFEQYGRRSLARQRERCTCRVRSLHEQRGTFRHAFGGVLRHWIDIETQAAQLADERAHHLARHGLGEQVVASGIQGDVRCSRVARQQAERAGAHEHARHAQPSLAVTQRGQLWFARHARDRNRDLARR